MTLILERRARTRPRRVVIGFTFAFVLLGLSIAASLLVGTREIGLGAVIDALVNPDTSLTDTALTDRTVILDLRVPRTVVGLLAGLALGLAGALMQGVTRNPLADPGLLGVNAGASLFVVAGVAWFGVTSSLGYVWFAFAGAAAAATIVYLIGSLGREGATPVKLALAGTALTAAFTSLITIVLLADTAAFDRYRFWAAGSLVARGLDAALPLAPFILIGAILAIVAARMLNALALGDDLARGLGQNLMLARVVCAVAIVLLCGSATAMAGPIVFVGLAVPHVARWITGPDYRLIIAFSALFGPTLLVAADVLGRVIGQPGEIEAGLVVSFLGAPVLIALVRRVKLAGL
ncbi:iron ABC transporter permease [Cryobacterium sp. TMT1-3]|uniref:Iron ABC transporter permease n=1 Tax=Cryobacterium luteum TaxID=1424661 RepID=A0A1H8J251_9MICO|nr:MULTISPECIES: iron chelate uptake ABC transporter family permease subunit [Cryobacterium]TFB93289.1 iron ABC transporter permease [Cryobacterium luteum]TFC28730.1 iron ABC transporter permease [Cryobacterium sp. TMT1-3]SEN74802.1 iron complex transport system permease protein [Cryobacterium luteum]